MSHLIPAPRPDSETTVEPGAFLRHLRDRGLSVLVVAHHLSHPDLFTVHLDPRARQWVDGQARRLIRQIPGVLQASDSSRTPAIVHVRVHRAPARSE